MPISEYATYDATGLAELVSKKEVTPLELLEEAIARVEKHNPTLNAVVYKAYDEARSAAKSDLPDGPFRGVPFLIKDIGAMVQGWPTTAGSQFLKDNVANQDTELVRRFRQAGLVLFGKSNTPEFGITGTTEGKFLGICRNPWNPEHSSGGSSGGAAAAVSAGILPMAHASDGLGSIRIPAAMCGLFGLKITRDRNPGSGVDTDRVIGFVVEHVVSRSVRDSAAMLDATGYAEADAPHAHPKKDRPYIDEIGAAPGKLRIAYSMESGVPGDIDPDVQQAFEDTIQLLKDLGHQVEEKRLGIDWRDMYRAQGVVSAGNFAAQIENHCERLGKQPEPDDFEPLTWASYKGGKKVSGHQLMQGWQKLRQITRQIMALYETYDVHLSPIMGTPPPKIGFLDPVNLSPKEFGKHQAQTHFTTPPANFTGQPAMSVPLAWSRDGLPIGMQFTGRYADEATLFRLASQLEQAQPWRDRHPAIWD